MFKIQDKKPIKLRTNPVDLDQSISTANNSSKGQGLTEYIILVGIIAIGSMLVVSKFGEAIKTATGNIVNVFSGQDSDTHRDVHSVGHEYMGRTDLWDSVKKRPSSRNRN